MCFLLFLKKCFLGTSWILYFHLLSTLPRNTWVVTRWGWASVALPSSLQTRRLPLANQKMLRWPWLMTRLQDFKETNLTSLLGLTLRTSTSPSSSTTGFGLSACSDLSAAAAPARMWAPFSSGLASKWNDVMRCLLVSWHSALSCSLHLFAFFSGEGRLRYN